jgi:hypothetical protein
MKLLRSSLVLAPVAGALFCLSLVLPATSGATILPPWGSSLAATPTLDTANGASYATDDMPLSTYNGGAQDNGGSQDEGIYTSFTAGCMHTYDRNDGTNKTLPCTNWIHSGGDNTLWNTSVAGGSATAPQGGQVLDIKVKGCAVKDTSTPGGIQTSTGDGGQQVPVNWLEFQALTPQSGGSFAPDPSPATAGPDGTHFALPFCSNSADPTQGPVSTSTVTTYEPVHMCIASGGTVSFYDNGGTILAASGAPIQTSWYPQGVPFMVISSVGGSNTDSFTDSHGLSSYNPGQQPNGNNSGWGTESGHELMLQVIEGVGDDAYGLCPGGNANEGSNSNTVICVYHHTNPGDPYGTCDSSGNPVYAPVNTAPPSISGTASVGKPLTEVHGTWRNFPPGVYFYQWEDCDASGNNCQAIAGGTTGCAAQGACYYPTSSDVGHTIRVEEWAANSANKEGPAVSAPTAVVTTNDGGAGGSSGGGGTGGGGGGGSSTATPVITLLKLNPGTFFSARGTTITFNLNRSATVSFKVISLKTHKVVKKFTHASHPGGNAAKLRGLKAGRYELVAVATAGGKTSKNAVKNFTVKPSRRHTVRHTARLAADVLPF